MAKPAKGSGNGLTPKRKPHRPAFAWTADVEQEILARIIGGESVVQICGVDRDDFIPSERTFYEHLASDADFSQRYARAREAQGHREADEIRTIADEATPENVAVARLQIDARKWRAGKLAPKVYGEKTVVEGPGPNGAHLVTTIRIVAEDGSGDDQVTT